VLVLQVDVIRAEAPQRTLNRGADIRRAAVERAARSASVGNEAEFRSHYNLVAAALERFADESSLVYGP
jgi:hypothetical protein